MVSYFFFVQITIIFLLSLSQECYTVILLFIIISSVFLSLFFAEFITKFSSFHDCFRKFLIHKRRMIASHKFRFTWIMAGFWKGEDENRADLCLRSIVLAFFRKRQPLMLHPNFQNGGKDLSIEKPPVGRRWLRS